MALFGKKDELFEIMARGSGSGGSRGLSSAEVARRSEVPSTPLERPKVTKPWPQVQSGAWPQVAGAWQAPTKTTRSWRRGGEAEVDEAFLELEGDAIVLVDDGFMDGLEAEDGPEVSMFAIRADTAIVGTLLASALLVAAFFMGRTTTTPEGPAVTGPGEVSVVVVPPAAAEPQPAPVSVMPTPTAVPASFRPEPAVVETPTAEPAEATEPAQEPEAAAAPAAPALGNYFLNVCTTSPTNGEKLAKWFNEDPRSPIFGREGLQAEVTTRGTVRIRGFAERDEDVRKRVRATSDPLGGGGTFGDAYFRSAR